MVLVAYLFSYIQLDNTEQLISFTSIFKLIVVDITLSLFCVVATLVSLSFPSFSIHLQIAPFDPTKKKKKKKVVIQDPADDSVDSLAEKTENLSGI